MILKNLFMTSSPWRLFCARLCPIKSFSKSGGPDLAKFCHFGKVFGKLLTDYFLIGKMRRLLWQICDIIGLILIAANGQILKSNLTIWSHCSKSRMFLTSLCIHSARVKCAHLGEKDENVCYSWRKRECWEYKREDNWERRSKRVRG